MTPGLTDPLGCLFLDMIAAERGAAVNTLHAYERDLVDYCDFLDGAGSGPKQATTQQIRAYLETLDARGFKATSIARHLSCVRQFHRFLYVEGRRDDDPAAVIEGPRRGRSLPKVLTPGEVDRLLAVAREGIDDPARPAAGRLAAARMHCLLETLYATGLRVSELVALPRDDAPGLNPDPPIPARQQDEGADGLGGLDQHSLHAAHLDGACGGLCLGMEGGGEE